MNQKVRTLAASELHSAAQYMDRLFHALIEVTNLGATSEAKDLSQHYLVALYNLLEEQLFVQDLWQKRIPRASAREAREVTRNVENIFLALLRMDFHVEKTIDATIEFINLIYEHAHGLHLLCVSDRDIDIQIPRINLIHVVEGSDEIEDHEDEYDFDLPIPRFILSKESLWTFSADDKSELHSLNWQRDKRFDSLVQAGHEKIFAKDYERALDDFMKAMNYKETAEVLTLIGWSYSLLNKIEKAKSYCLKAIQKDPDYGPPYNDLGTYLMTEGQLDEAIKWFDLAKKSLKYHNREYPYINAGRAWMQKRDLEKALEEFSIALTLAPYHEELHETVEKLKKTIHRSTFKLNGEGDEGPPPSVF